MLFGKTIKSSQFAVTRNGEAYTSASNKDIKVPFGSTVLNWEQSATVSIQENFKKLTKNRKSYHIWLELKYRIPKGLVDLAKISKRYDSDLPRFIEKEINQIALKWWKDSNFEPNAQNEVSPDVFEKLVQHLQSELLFQGKEYACHLEHVNYQISKITDSHITSESWFLIGYGMAVEVLLEFDDKKVPA